MKGENLAYHLFRLCAHTETVLIIYRCGSTTIAPVLNMCDRRREHLNVMAQPIWQAFVRCSALKARSAEVVCTVRGTTYGYGVGDVATRLELRCHCVAIEAIACCIAKRDEEGK